MLLGKSLSIAASNWKVMLKSLVCQIIIVALTFSLGYFLFGEVAKQLAQIYLQNNVGDFISSTITSLSDGTFDSTSFAAQLTGMLANLRDEISLLENRWNSVELSYILFFVVFVFYRVLLSLTDVTVGCQVSEFMTSNAYRPFTWYFVKKQGEMWIFALLQVAVALPLDLLVIFGCMGFYLTYLVAFASWTIIPAIIIAALLFAARFTFTSLTLPSVVLRDSSTSVAKAFSKGLALSIERFFKVFFKNLLAISIILVLAIVGTTFITNPVWTAVVSVLPSLFIFFILKCVGFVEYFEASNQPYFHKYVDVYGSERASEHI